MKKRLLFTATTAIIATALWLLSSHNQAFLSLSAGKALAVQALSQTKPSIFARTLVNTSSSPARQETRQTQQQTKGSDSAPAMALLASNEATPQPVQETAMQSVTIAPEPGPEPGGSSPFLTKNRKPQLNQHVYAQLQRQIYGWELTQNSPVSVSLSVEDLFTDPDNDFLTTQIQTNVPGLKVRYGSRIHLLGAPSAAIATAMLTIAVRDDHHGNDQDAWVTAAFELPFINRSMNDKTHPLVSTTFYRLETTQQLGGRHYPYEVVYCEAWKLVNEQVFFAAARNRTRCPDEDDLRLVGSYQFEQDDLLLTSDLSDFDAQQRWIVRKIYPSRFAPESNNLLTTVKRGDGYETYTLQTDKVAMERRLNVHTGQRLYQGHSFDYQLTDPQDNYIDTTVMNYIFDRRAINPAEYQRYDSDLNIFRVAGQLDCQAIQPYFLFSRLAGQGRVGPIISDSARPNDLAHLDCHANPYDTAQSAIYINHDFEDQNPFVAGEIYSYILRPKPEYAHLLEELKLNMIYHHARQNSEQRENL
ncbi:hypothetical protein [Photobacterium sp. TY1-4]|uniref:hypothetical protein n=1 Tax=Photobacterium sp. TY1-4 TaxID=2899122 RepID=UPI0021BF6495|nr:hypothetical protein [Photobacterium sp. TY1-4]UXI01344.1 hypothetical protein NH461_00260 [Photobacterium sp. TY1-4]